MDVMEIHGLCLILYSHLQTVEGLLRVVLWTNANPKISTLNAESRAKTKLLDVLAY